METKQIDHSDLGPDSRCGRCAEAIRAGEETFHLTMIHHPSRKDPRLIPAFKLIVCGGCYLQIRGGGAVKL